MDFTPSPGLAHGALQEDWGRMLKRIPVSPPTAFGGMTFPKEPGNGLCSVLAERKKTAQVRQRSETAQQRTGSSDRQASARGIEERRPVPPSATASASKSSSLLNEGVHTADQLAELIGETRQTTFTNHLQGAARRRLDRNRQRVERKAQRHRSTATEPSTCRSSRQEEVAAMTSAQRQMTAGLIVQSSSTAEIMAALASGKLSDDPRVLLVWRLVQPRRTGTTRAAEQRQERLLGACREIEAEADQPPRESAARTPSRC